MFGEKEMELLLEKQATSIKEYHKTELLKANEEVHKLLKEVEERYKDGNKATEEQVTALKGATEKFNEKYEAMQKQLDALDIKMQKGYGTVENKKSFKEVLAEGLGKHTEILRAKALEGKHFDFGFDLHSKAVGDMSTASNISGTEFVTPTRVPGVVGIPSEPDRIRNWLPTGTTNSNLIKHIRYVLKEGGPGMVAEGAVKPQMDFDLTIVDTPVRKIGTHVRVPEEMIEDIPFLSSFISAQGMIELMLVEDEQLLTGDGTGQNLSGLITTAADFTAPAGLFENITAPQYISVLRAAMAQVRLNYYRPTAIMLHPSDVTYIKELKKDDKGYLVEETLNNPVPSLDGVPIVQNSHVPQGEFLVGNFALAVQLFDRMLSNVRFYDQDQDNAVRNMITVVIEERLALVTYRPNAMVYGAFGAGITALDIANAGA